MVILLDNGHGAIQNGHALTPGKRSPIHPDGRQLIEGEFNRAIVARIIEQLTILNVKYVNITPEMRDVSIATRIRRANQFYLHRHKSVLISIHANAGGGSGFEVFTSPGQTKADRLADYFADEFRAEFPNYPVRVDYSDGDQDKEKRFKILTRSWMPAILTENFFMDQYEECKNILMTRTGRDAIANFHVRAIERIIEDA